MNFVIDLGIVVLVLTLLVGGLAVWRIGHVVSWRALLMVARATGSFAECVNFIRFCAEDVDTAHRNWSREQQLAPRPARTKHSLEEQPHAS